MKIYFAASIRGGRQDAAIYREIIDHLKLQGKVLTEHIGSTSLGDMGENKPAEEIFERDVAWIKEADAVIAEVTTPSLGVGYELGIAQAHGKQILCLYRDDLKKLSAMVAGNKYNTVRAYKDVQEARFIIDAYKNVKDACGIIDKFIESTKTDKIKTTAGGN